MRSISWLHISDVHMRPRDAWSQDVVLRAMAEDIAQRHRENPPDFILVSGDLAFSGRTEEYSLVAAFLDALCVASNLPRERIFCIPGNHDIARDRQKLAFAGARYLLQDQNHIDTLLAPAAEEDLDALLKREEAYRRFQADYFGDQVRLATEDRLAYVAYVTIDDVRLAIIALDSAWLSEGGIEDHGKLLIGERQVINAIKLAQNSGDPPHVVLAMSHHPLHVLQDFDRRPIQNRIERACQFVHCGHLHEPEARTGGHLGGGCLTLSAGASFETRHTRNSYSLVSLDLLHARRTIMTVHYDANEGRFSAVETADYPVDVQPSGTCSIGALATAVAAYGGKGAVFPNYLAALLLDQKADIVIPTNDGGFAFGSLAVLASLGDSDLRRRTTEFIAFRNALRLFYPRMPLDEIFRRHGEAVPRYQAALSDLAATNLELGARLTTHENDARRFAAAEPLESSSQTTALLQELAESRDWTLLRQQAERHIDSPNHATAVMARRMLGLALANSGDPADTKAAISHFRHLVDGGSPEPTDHGNLALLLAEHGDGGNAKMVLLRGIDCCVQSGATDYFAATGHKLVESTGDRDFRKQLEEATRKRGRE